MNDMSAPVSTLNEGQQAAADAFFRFLFNPDAKTFVISGGPGVGKTYLMSHLVRHTMKEYEDTCSMLGQRAKFTELAFTATTNKAAEVLEESLGMDVSTIHSYMGLKVQESWKTGETFIQKTNSWTKKYNKIIFIDECSMVDSVVYDIIGETFEDSKIVFVGDHCQMAPVGEEISPVFKNVDPDNFVFLDKPVRNANFPALVQLCSQLRETVETGEFKRIEEVSGVIDYVDDEGMQEVLEHYFTDLNPSARCLCYTNFRVESYNGYIRSDIRKQPIEYQVGDVLVVATNLASASAVLSVEREVRIEELSSVKEDHEYDDFIPKPILYREATLRLLGGTCNLVKVRLPVDKDQVQNLIRGLAKAKSWQEYFEVKNTYADLRDKAACTVYKAQGSTYEAVVIDIGNIGTSFDKNQVARMLLVAASRATTRIFLYGRLPPAYRG